MSQAQDLAGAFVNETGPKTRIVRLITLNGRLAWAKDPGKLKATAAQVKRRTDRQHSQELKMMEAMQAYLDNLSPKDREGIFDAAKEGNPSDEKYRKDSLEREWDILDRLPVGFVLGFQLPIEAKKIWKLVQESDNIQPTVKSALLTAIENEAARQGFRLPKATKT